MSHHNHFDSTKPIVISTPPPALNATKHGCCALDTLILPTENIKDLKALSAAWYRTYSPKQDTETHLVDQLVAADWLLQRSVRTLADLEAQILAEQSNPRYWSDDDHKAITRFQRYRTANQNAFTKCRRAIEDHYKSRVSDSRREDTHAIAKERHLIYKEKNKPERTFETLARMRKQSHRLRLPPNPGAHRNQVKNPNSNNVWDNFVWTTFLTHPQAQTRKSRP
jgi:hypothetical protein